MNEQKTQKFHLDRKKLLAIGIITLCVALIVALTILLYPSKTTPIDHFFRALQKGSDAELHKCMPQEAWDRLSTDYEASGKQLSKQMTALVVESEQAMRKQLGDKLKISYHVTDKRDYDNEKLDKLAHLLADKFGLKPELVTEACEIVTDTTSKGTKGEHTDESELYIVYKYNNKWYLYFDPLASERQ